MLWPGRFILVESVFQQNFACLIAKKYLSTDVKNFWYTTTFRGFRLPLLHRFSHCVVVGTFLVPFGTFFAHVSTPTRKTTTKLLLGPLSRARGQKAHDFKYR